MLSKKSFNFLTKLPLPLLLLAITIASHQQRLPDFTNMFTFEDKLLHFSAYFVLGSFIAFQNDKDNKFTLLKFVSLGFVYAVLDEIHQYFIPGRQFDIKDILADWVGLIVAFLLRQKVYQFRQYLQNKFTSK